MSDEQILALQTEVDALRKENAKLREELDWARNRVAEWQYRVRKINWMLTQKDREVG